MTATSAALLAAQRHRRRRHVTKRRRAMKRAARISTKGCGRSTLKGVWTKKVVVLLLLIVVVAEFRYSQYIQKSNILTILFILALSILFSLSLLFLPLFNTCTTTYNNNYYVVSLTLRFLLKP